MASFTPTVQPLNVTPAGTVATIPIPAGYRRAKISRILIAHLSGSLTLFTATVSTDPAVADVILQVARYPDLLPLTTVDDDNSGNAFSWDGEDHSNWTSSPKNIYVELVPNAGTDNAFSVAVYVDRGR